jgi:transcriptional regulator with XRE-family HTH domain
VLGETIRRIRKRRGETGAEFAKLLGCRQATISGYETGKINPSRSMLLLILQHAEASERGAILDALEVDADLQDEWAPGELEDALAGVQAYLDAGGKGVQPPRRENTLRSFAELALEVLRNGDPVRTSVLDMLRLWIRHGEHADRREFFDHAAAYLEVQLLPLSGAHNPQKPRKRGH